MRVPFGWLRELLELEGFPSAEAVAEQLTMNGLEVDSIERTGPDLEGIRVGYVIERAQHPDADRLGVCSVDLGEGEPRQIVCGAPNVAGGQKVAVAVPGTRIQGKKLKKSKIRGVPSLGMICSERELGLSEEHEGILVLDPDAPVGAPLDSVLGAGDEVLEVAIMANRGDWASMLGVARELKAAFGGSIRLPESAVAEEGPPAADTVRVAIDDPAGCTRYAARVVRGARNRPSPDWLVAKIESVGLRSRGAIVDVTNLVMFELGQPLHAFDLAKLRGNEVRVRRAAEGETLRTLDDVERKLAADDLVIADGERAIALAGVMGGTNSEVDDVEAHADLPVDLLLESAHFDASSVRRTARRHGLSSDASYRFERGVDRGGVERALDRAARLIGELTGGAVAPGIVTSEGDAPPANPAVTLDPERVNRLLGTGLEAATMRALLERLDITVEETGDGALRCTAPSHRGDLRIPADFVEEIARIHGYQHIPLAPLSGVLGGAGKPRELTVGDAVRDALVAEGATEVVTIPFIAEDDLDRIRLAEDDSRRRTVRVVNPIAEDQPRVRSTLVPSLVRLACENRNRQIDSLRIFEVARAFEALGSNELPNERRMATLLVVRGSEPALWQPQERPPLFFTAKGIASRVLGRLERAVDFVPPSSPEDGEPYLHPGASCAIAIGGQRVGHVGELHPEVAARFELDAEAALLELDVDRLAGSEPLRRQFQDVSRQPAVERDLAILVDTQQPAGELLTAIRKQGGALLREAQIFDRYAGKGVPEGRLSLAFRLIFQHAERTLTDAEVGKAVDGVLRMLQHRFGAEQR